ncbi:TonB-dependent siderophore receptor [Sphingomonas montana]|uniref:TonB-dependent siderophore receptor n=1 Tax=Sphingomonas montana TaxID=1843236 RepID=UPI0009F9E580|nr:TonB-dependent siderophore receptor [Sphingomonas montana]
MIVMPVLSRSAVCGVRRAALFALLMLGAATPALAAADLATAATDDRDVPETVVVTGARTARPGITGTKTDTPLIETPQAITVIDNAELVRRNALSINQALTYVAGVAPNQRGGVATRYDQLFVRGFSPGVYLDGMRLLGGIYATPQVDFHLIDRVDVIKGPASVLYGNSTPGGLVNLTSKLPYAGRGGQVELAGGNYDLARGSIDINQPLDASDRWLFRVIGGGERSDGFIARTTNERYYIRPMLTFAPDADTSLSLILNYQRDPQAASYSGVSVYGSALANPLGRFPTDLNVSEPDYEAFDRRQTSVSTLFRHDFSPAFSFTSNMRWLRTKLHYRQVYLSDFAVTGTGANANTDFGTIVRGGGGSDEDFRTLTLDNRVTGTFDTGPLRHTVLAGLDYQNNRGSNAQQFNTGVAQGIPNLNLFAPVYGLPVRDFPLTQTRGDRRVNQTGVYLQDQVAIGGLQLIASGRYDWYDQTSVNRVTNGVTRLDQTAFTMRLGALYEFGFGAAPFFSYSESFEPQTGTLFDGTPFDPVTGRQYEGGIKYQVPGTNALFTLSAFDLRRRRVPVADPAAGTGNIPANSNIQIGEVAIRGIELEGRGEILPGVDVVVAGTYTDPKVTKGNDPAKVGLVSGATGTKPLGVPTWSAASFLSYDLARDRRASGPLSGLNVGAGVRYVGASDGTASQIIAGRTILTRFRSPGFVLVDAVLGYDLGKAAPALEGFSAMVNATNLFDKRHIASCFFNNSCYFGASRTVVGTLRYKW